MHPSRTSLTSPSVAGEKSAQFTDYLLALHEEVYTSGLPNYRCCRCPVLTSLNIPQWRECLRNYHDSRVCDYVQFGWPVNYDYVSFHFPVSNDRTHKGALDFPTAITQYLNSKIACGAVCGLFDAVPFSSGRKAFSPLNSIPKSDPLERRIILDLSWPFGTLVNDGISTTEYDGCPLHLVYPTIDMVAACVACFGRGCYIYKRDLHQAYRQFPVDSRDYPLLGYTWQGRLYFKTVLPMGLCLAAMACQRITSAVCHACSKAGFTILNYLDDFMGIDSASRAWQSYCYLQDLFSSLGLQESI